MTEIIPDRPWATREYGRLRLNEVFAKHLSQILTEELDRLHADRMKLRMEGREVTNLNRDIRRASRIKILLHGMMHEKGWCDGDDE